jgi:choice-of-anchor C domain-containing protein
MLLSVAPAADNTPPQSSGIPDVAVDEDAPDTVIDLWAAFSDDTDPDDALVFSIATTTAPGTSFFRALAIDNKTGTLTLRYGSNANGNASIVVRATDRNQASSLEAFDVAVRAVNDAPVNRVPGPQAVPVDTPLVFNQANSIFVSDPDLSTGNITVTVRVDDGGPGASGTLTLARTSDIQFLQGDGQADTLMSFTGTARSGATSALQGLRFDPAPGFTGTATLTITSDDQGNTGAGGALTDTDTVPIRVVAPASVSVSDARILEGNDGTTAASVTVSLPAPHPLPVSVHWSTADGTATGAARLGELIPNGGFEQPDITGSSWYWFGAGATIGPWVVESGSVDIVSMWQNAEGVQSLDLCGSGPGAVYQDVPTVPGQVYTLRFALSGNPEVRGTDRVKQVTVDVNGAPLQMLSFDTTGRTFDNMGWEYHEYAITATSETTRVRFSGLNNTDTGPAIDDVRLMHRGGDEDYGSASGVVQFAPGETSKTLTLVVSGDTRVEADETFFVDLSQPTGATIRSGRGTVTILNDDGAAPRVTQVFASSPQWPQVFKDRMTSDGLGSGTFGFGVPGGPGDGARLAQLAPLPWQNVSQVSVRFDADVVVAQDDLEVRGDDVERYDVTGFAYDRESHAATWTIAQPFSDDRIELVLDSGEDGVRAAGEGGAALDGEWNNEPGARPAQAYPSGDGAAGGDFRFRFNVLPGDVNGTDGRVTALDSAEIRKRLGRVAADHVTGPNAYSVFADLNTDGRINALDLAAVRKRLGHALPVIESAPPPAALPAPSGPAPAPITQELLAPDEQPF